MKLRQKFLQKKKRENIRDAEITKMLTGIETLSEKQARDVMVPRVDVLAVDKDTDPNDLFNFVASSTHSKFPIYQDTIDNIIGVLYVKDLLKVATDIESLDLLNTIRQAFFVPETMNLDMLMHEMKRKRIHIAIVVDEYGGVSGIVCLEDILEEIVGKILDEFDNEAEEFIKIGNGVYLVEARLPISNFNEFLKLSLPEEDYETVGGFVYDHFGKIPACYEKLRVDNIDYIIQAMDGNKIKSIKVVVNET